ncbi:beta-D-xylosidase 1 [Aplysia californica]|uniref:Beta-D-xylosidase 1 n=1 Tax=Aplysia californica TaxID=6500 RepID=A0ABM1A1T2_APLCA|nr:beta-D-xylosidase 1 [Aplysia californica]
MRTVLSRLPCCISFLILALCVSNNGVVGSRLSRRHHDTVRHMSVEVEDSPFDDFPFRNTSLPWDERVDDLVSRLTLQEVMVQMSRGGAGEFGGPAPAIPRLGIGAYNWDTECLRGDSDAVENATGFPQAIGLAATFSPDIILSVATATGQEVRAKHNDFVKRGIFATHTSASCFSPVINIMRDPRWGRNQETYGEDPYMTGVLAQNFVRGLQGRLKIVKWNCIHFYDGGLVSDTDWRMTFLPAFKKCVEAGTYSIMCSYNSMIVSSYQIIGPMADNATQLFGDYAPNQDPSFTQTPLDGLRSLYPDIKYGEVCNDGTPCTEYNKGAVPGIVSDKELVFVALGTGQDVEREGHDRPDVELAGHQKELLLDVLDNSGSAQIILLLFSASPLNITFADESDRVAAIMECFFPAQATGEALYNVLTNNGQYSSPAGRLPSTWPLYSSQIPPMVNYSMEGRTYRYFKGDPLYPFGYGLSYTQFLYADMTYFKNVKAGNDLDLQLAVTNVGPIDGEEVVQCYISWVDKSLPVPQLQLAYFTRVFIPSQQTRMLSITISGESMAFWRDGQWIVELGDMYLYCGGQQPYQKRRAPSNVLSDSFTIISRTE